MAGGRQPGTDSPGLVLATIALALLLVVSTVRLVLA
jgi:hypothetical protein